MAREVFATPWIKLEVIGDDYNLQPDPFGLGGSRRILMKESFVVFPYCTDDLVLCQKLVDVGCEILMPWQRPSAQPRGCSILRSENLRRRLPAIPLIVDAGLGLPSQRPRSWRWVSIVCC